MGDVKRTPIKDAQDDIYKNYEDKNHEEKKDNGGLVKRIQGALGIEDFSPSKNPVNKPIAPIDKTKYPGFKKGGGF